MKNCIGNPARTTKTAGQAALSGTHPYLQSWRAPNVQATCLWVGGRCRPTRHDHLCRAARSEFWWFMLLYWLISMGFFLVMGLIVAICLGLYITFKRTKWL